MSDVKILNAALNYKNLDSETSLNSELFQNSLNTFNLFDTNQDGTLEEDEINNFYKNIDSSDGKLDSSLSEDALLKYIENSGFNQNNAEELIEFTNQVYSLTQEEDSNLKIYSACQSSADKSTIADGIIDNFSQGYVLGDCWLLASIYSQSQVHPDLIYDAIKQDSEGNYLVSFDGVDEDYEISNEEFQQALQSQRYSRGDADTILLELAMEKRLTAHMDDSDTDMQKKLKLAEDAVSEYNVEYDVLTAGYQVGHATLAYALKGDGGKWYAFDSEEKENELYGILTQKAQDSSSYTITCNLSNIDDSQIEAYKERGLYTHHTYSLSTKIDDNGDMTIVLVNPHDTSKTTELSYSEFRTISAGIGVSK